MTMLAFVRILFNTFLFLFSIAFLAVLIGFYLQLREMRREAAQGKLVRWYKRPTLLSIIAIPLLWAGELTSVATSIHILPENPFLYILIVLMLVAAVSLIIYSFKLSWGQIKSRLFR